MGRRLLLGAGRGSRALGLTYSFNSITRVVGPTSTSGTAAYPGSLPGNVLVVLVLGVGSASAPFSSVADGAGAFTQIGQNNAGGGNDYLGYAWRTSAPSGNITWTQGGSAAATALIGVFPVSGGTPTYDSGGTYTQGAGVTPAWTTTASAGTANSLLVGAIGPNAGQMTFGGTWSGSSTAGDYLAFAYEIRNGSSSAYALNDNAGSASGYFNSVIGAFK